MRLLLYRSKSGNVFPMDETLFVAINQHATSPALDKTMALLSSWAAWWPIAAVAAILLFWLGGFRGRAFLIVAVFTVGITDGLVTNTLKKIVQRPRPYQALVGTRSVDLARATPRILALAQPVRVRYSTVSEPVKQGRSFPSNHAASNFVLATILIAFYRRWGWLYLVPAMGVTYSRIYIGSHYPSDALAGTFIGVFVALVVLSLSRKLWRTFAPHLAPNCFHAHPQLF